MLIPPASLELFVSDALVRAGLPVKASAVTSKVLVFADLRGVDSHGVRRLPIYLKRLTLGSIKADAEPRVIRELESTALVDGGSGIGPYVADFAMRLSMEKASGTGVGTVGVRNSNHFGIGAYYAMSALQHCQIGVVMTNTSPLMVPFGGVERILGTNPISIAIPAGEEPPIVLDMATSAVARGKVELALAQGKEIPLDWAVNEEGEPTHDPRAALGGALLPMAGAKGYGLAVIVDALSGVLTGAAFGSSVGSLFGDLESPQRVGHLFITLDVSRFMDTSEFKARMDDMIRSIKYSRPRKGVERVLLPGEPEHIVMEERKKHGIPLTSDLEEVLHRIAAEVGMEEGWREKLFKTA